METNTEKLEQLKAHLGSWQAVATDLEITDRYLRMIRKKGKVGRHLAKIIDQKTTPCPCSKKR
jgi:hypothetical protein